MVEKCSPHYIFCIRQKFFWAVRIFQFMLQQLVEWAIWCNFDCLSIIVHGKILYATWSGLTEEDVFCSPHSPCAHMQKTHQHVASPPHHCGQTICLLEFMPQVCMVKPESGLRWPCTVPESIQSTLILKRMLVISNWIVFHSLKHEVLYKK